ncbi:hypothetical protein [Pseudoalteromonas sp. BDTF-M6]|uniref:hypothetical protein n=1 Tax=Pseudoalteromonas sp. BDTF-M6 TaxID=2796132 RepID=UPI001BAE5DD3|nr:hypothetical protein [Pseudoalteromonas sp. BDTF-M6]MBS3796670.1 hypothetical protein [Pseudoalteromonas sp. BDTF-M6]
MSVLATNNHKDVLAKWLVAIAVVYSVGTLVVFLLYFDINPSLPMSDWVNTAVYFNNILSPVFLLITIFLVYFTYRDNKAELQGTRQLIKNQIEHANYESARKQVLLIVDELSKDINTTIPLGPAFRQQIVNNIDRWQCTPSLDVQRSQAQSRLGSPAFDWSECSNEQKLTHIGRGIECQGSYTMMTMIGYYLRFYYSNDHTSETLEHFSDVHFFASDVYLKRPEKKSYFRLHRKILCELLQEWHDNPEVKFLCQLVLSRLSTEVMAFLLLGAIDDLNRDESYIEQIKMFNMVFDKLDYLHLIYAMQPALDPNYKTMLP